jgi:hypothetical protein
MSKKKKLIWVDPSFATMLKMKAIDNDKNVLSYTRELGEEANRLKGKKVNDNFWKIL